MSLNKSLVRDRFESNYKKITRIAMDAGSVPAAHSGVGDSDSEEQRVCDLVVVFVFLASLIGALGRLVFGRC